MNLLFFPEVLVVRGDTDQRNVERRPEANDILQILAFI